MKSLIIIFAGIYWIFFFTGVAGYNKYFELIVAALLTGAVVYLDYKEK